MQESCSDCDCDTRANWLLWWRLQPGLCVQKGTGTDPCFALLWCVVCCAVLCAGFEGSSFRSVSLSGGMGPNAADPSAQIYQSRWAGDTGGIPYVYHNGLVGLRPAEPWTPKLLFVWAT